MAIHKVVIVVDVEANTYDQATELAAEFLDSANMDSPGIDDATVELNFEYDGTEYQQRVLYLPNENDPDCVGGLERDHGMGDDEDDDETDSLDPDKLSLEDLA